MDKPTLFISHSSADKEYLRALKELIDQKTGGTLDIFLSSDGQSIPFGANWVHSVETALEKASVMFVAVSPKSVDSSWVYFEAGYTYSRKIKVIPIGINGLNIERIRPPLSLLQGFNLVSHHGLNNLITIINREYKCRFQEDFRPEEYETLKIIGATQSSAAQKYTVVVDFISALLPLKIDGKHELTKDTKERLEQLLTEMNLPFFQVDDSTIMLNGARILLPREGDRAAGHDSTNGISLKLDLLCASWGLPLIRRMFGRLYDSPPPKFWFKVYFQQHAKVLTTDFKVASRLGSAGIGLWPERANLFQFEDLLFVPEGETNLSARGRVTDGPSYLRIVGNTLSEGGIPVLSLLDALMETGVVELGS